MLLHCMMLPVHPCKICWPYPPSKKGFQHDSRYKRVWLPSSPAINVFTHGPTQDSFSPQRKWPRREGRLTQTYMMPCKDGIRWYMFMTILGDLRQACVRQHRRRNKQESSQTLTSRHFLIFLMLFVCISIFGNG